MKVNHIKQLFVALFLLLSAGTATAAQWKLAKTNLNAAGSKDTLTLKVSDNTVGFLLIPSGFHLAGGRIAERYAYPRRAGGRSCAHVEQARRWQLPLRGIQREEYRDEGPGCRATHSGSFTFLRAARPHPVGRQ